MKTPAYYPFYSSLRFRFGVIFGLTFLCFLLVIEFILYSNVKGQFEKSFTARLKTQGNLILQETEINPFTIPFPSSSEYFCLIYDANKQQDTLFNNLPSQLGRPGVNLDPTRWRGISLKRTLETGGAIRILYVLPAKELVEDTEKLQLILFLYFPLAFVAALGVGYLLSGFLLRPIEGIVKKANDISLQGEIHLLQEPIVHDELHRLAVSLNRMLDQIQKQSQYQNAFFASASHELRTPLSVMLTELQILQKDHLSQTIKPIIENQITEVQRLNKLVNDFLLLSQLKSGALILTKNMTNLVDVVLEVLERFSDRALANSQTFKVELLPENGEFHILIDRSHLITILINLTENAVKYGRTDSTIHVTIEEKGEQILLSVKNISQTNIEDPAALLQEFSKQHSSGDGFGLGLWIVNRLAEKVGAKFKVLFSAPYFIAQVDFFKGR